MRRDRGSDNLGRSLSISLDLSLEKERSDPLGFQAANGLMAAGAASALALGALFVSQRSLLFPAPREGASVQLYGGAAAVLVEIAVWGEERPKESGGRVLGAWFAPESDEAPVVVFFHGNADQIGWGASYLGAPRGVLFSNEGRARRV